MENKKITFYKGVIAGLVVAFALTLGMLLGLPQVLAQWTEPTCPPPGCNTLDPVNVGDTSQYKSGALSVGGDMGVGTNAPQSRLDVVGGDINMDAGRTIYSRGRMHIDGEEHLYLLNRTGVTVSKSWGGNGNMRVDGYFSSPGVPVGGIERVCTNDSSAFIGFRNAWGLIDWDTSGGGGPCFAKGIGCFSQGTHLVAVNQYSSWAGAGPAYAYSYFCVGD